MSRGRGRIVAGLKEAGIRVVASVPDSWLGPLIADLEADRAFAALRVTREDEGIAVCTGAVLGGAPAAMLLQNGGLLLCGTALTTLPVTHRLPLLLLVSHRGTLEDPIFYHAPKAAAAERSLEALQVPFLKPDPAVDLATQVVQAQRVAVEAARPFALLLGRDDLA
jgi:sulfopyruvate decarboxylase subunit alpha